MTPDEMRSIVEAALRDGLRFPWWAYCAAFLVSMGGAAAGAYIRKLYENKADARHFDALREQLRRTTKDTEEIKAVLSGAQWLTQQQWSIREQRYSSLLLELARLHASLVHRATYFIGPGSEHNDAIPEKPAYKEQSRRGLAALEAIREQMGPAEVFLSPEAIAALTALDAAEWDLVNFGAICHDDYVTQALALVEEARDAVLRQAKAELVGVAAGSAAA